MFRYITREFPITSFFLALNLIVFVLQLSGMFSPINFLSYPGILNVGTFLSHFSHGSFIHIFFNLFIFFQVAPVLEKRLGSYFLFLVTIGIWLLTVAFLQPVLDAPTLGFSGILMGVISFTAALFYHIPPVRRQLTMLLLLNIGIGFLPGISFWGHLMGAAAGVVVYGVYRIST